MRKYATIFYYTALLQVWWLLQCIAFVEGQAWLAILLFAVIMACFEWSIEEGCKPKRQSNGRFA